MSRLDDWHRLKSGERVGGRGIVFAGGEEKKVSIKRYTLGEWLAEGKRRFGPDQLKWRFKCPACGHVQAVEDFRPFKAQGATAESARFNCIGRYAGARPNAGLNGKGSAEGPCDYTSGGLFDLRPVIVAKGSEDVRCFDFADAPTVEEGSDERTA